MFWIEIRIGSGFNWVRRSGFRTRIHIWIQTTKMIPEEGGKIKKFQV
jgi:hypothetical protein